MIKLRTIKKYGFICKYFCTECNIEVDALLMKITDWYTMLIIPIWPQSESYVIICPKCKTAKQIDQEEFKRLVSRFNKSSRRFIIDEIFEGKTNVQINYLSEMEKIRKEREQQKLD
ncbi:MAG: hypothetical protein K0R15_149 [Clostridiales bacterium]|jgi:hypothetical protein|nr:hypothetical protein [Clostridiales bacterium]